MTNSLKLALRTSSAVLAFAATISAAPAFAQDAAPTLVGAQTDQQAAAADAAAGNIVVTGSRLARAGYDAPTPVNVVGEERLKQLAIPNVADALNQIPSFRAITTPASNFFRVSGNIGGRSMDLRGLGATRTLTLLDGRRVVASSDNGTVDVNSLPNILIKRAEVVTGGASAAYGANAVSGVVNFILDDKLNHLKMDVNYGIAQRGDGQSFYAGIADGFDFDEGRGHVVLGGEYNREKGLGPCETRDYCNKYTNYIPNPGYIPPSGTTPGRSLNGLPATLVVDNQAFLYNENTILKGATYPTSAFVPGGAAQTAATLLQQTESLGNNNALPAALRGRQFDSAGNLIPYTFGQYLSGVFMVGRDPTQPYIIGLGQQPLVTPSEHFSGLARVNYDLTDDVTATVEFMLARVIGGPTQGASPIDDGYAVGFDNPYLSAATRAAGIAAISPLVTPANSTVTGGARPKLLVNSGSIDLGPGNISTTRITTYRAAAGLKGKVFGDWNWDTSYTHGVVKARLDDLNVRLKTWNEGYDATRTGQAAIIAPNGVVMASATPSLAANGIADGTIVCRSTLTNPTNGCIPFNFFGPNSVSPQAAAQHIKPEWQTRTFKQDSIMLNMRGSPFSTWAGDVSVAFGGEWRKDQAVGDVDPLTKAPLLVGAAANAGFISPQAVPLTSATRTDAAGNILADLSVAPVPLKTTVTEGYFEAGIPLLKDMPLGKALNIDGAVRFSHYKPFGDATTWKVGGVYTPISDITFRVTKSKDVRAPTAGELNPLATVTLLPLPNPFINQTQNISVVTGGNPNLKLEKGDTFTAGVVLKPTFIPRFNMSVDYYKIKVKGAIDTLSGSAIMTACQQTNSLCNLITFAGAFKASSITAIQSTFQNLSVLNAEGYEFVADYSVPLWEGNLAFQLNANYVKHLNTVTAVGSVIQLDNWTGNNGSVTNIQGVPRYKLDGVITYSRPTWSFTLHPRYIPRALLDPTKIGAEQAGYDINNPNSQTLNHVDARFYLDISASAKIADTRNDGKIEFYAAINNLFDKTEPKQLRLIGNPLHFDPYLRYFRFGIRATY